MSHPALHCERSSLHSDEVRSQARLKRASSMAWSARVVVLGAASAVH